MSKRGGKRKGSGRHKLPNPKSKKVSVSFSEADYDALKAKHPAYGELSRVIALLTVRSELS